LRRFAAHSSLARTLRSAALCGVALAGVALASHADSAPARELASAAAQRIGVAKGSEYWDLTVELENDYRVMARFLVTNQGPGKQNGTAVGHVISPDGSTIKFRNGRLQSGWTLSEDGLDLDIGKSHLDMHLPRYQLRVNKRASRIRIAFAPNTLHPLPKKLGGPNYRIDLLALGARVSGSIQLESMAEAIHVEGWATLTHTVAKRSETDLMRRRIEVFSQRGPRPLYAIQLLDPGGTNSSFLAWLEPGCDPAFDSELFPRGNKASDPACLRTLRTTNHVELIPEKFSDEKKKRSKKASYRVPNVLSISPKEQFDPKSAGVATEKELDISGIVTLGKRLLAYEPLDDLPGALRFLAGLSTKPRRVWSPARFAVTLPPAPDTTTLTIQGQGVATVSFTNRIKNP